MEETAFNPADRRLCPDGTCVGVIGADGHCRACGRLSEGGPPGERAAAEDVVTHSADGDVWTDDADSDAADATEREGASVGADGFDVGRRLCEDGSCLGVVGPNGACDVCGRRGA